MEMFILGMITMYVITSILDGDSDIKICKEMNKLADELARLKEEN